MSRSGWSEDWEPDSREDQWAWIRMRGAVNSAVKGKKGQAFLKDALEALEALPEKKLIKGEFVTPQGEVCLMGAVCLKRGIDVSNVDPDDDNHHKYVSELLGIAESLVQEVEFENDQALGYVTPEHRYNYMHSWITQRLVNE